MKSLKLLLLFFLFISYVANAQEEQSGLIMPVDEETGKITYKEVVEQEGEKSELFNRCIYWLNDFYANPVAVTKVRDPESGLIKGEHQFRLYHKDEDGVKKETGMMQYKFKIEFKEDRYRYVVNDFVMKRISRYDAEKWLDKSNPEYNIQWDDYLKQINTFVTEKWIPSLKEKMQPEKVFEEEEW